MNPYRSEYVHPQWTCPEGCKFQECIHATRERIRLVCAIYESLEGLAASVRMHLITKGSRTRRMLKEALDRYDAAVAAQQAGP